MGPKAAELMEQARQLAEEQRHEFAVELLDSTIALAIHQAWTEEARRRMAELDSGQVATISNEEAERIIETDE